MNKDLIKIINLLLEKKYTQRELASLSGFSVGKVNKLKNELVDSGIIVNGDVDESKIVSYKVKNAVIVSAGYGLRMLPINNVLPKALLMVNGKRIIEKQIEQLKEKGIDEIYVVVGYLKEKLLYLTDKYGVKLIVNEKYQNDNNALSILKAKKILGNSYIVPCDLIFNRNPFNKYEYCSWYALKTGEVVDGDYSVSRQKKLAKGTKYKAVGLSYVDDASDLVKNLEEITKDKKAFWEDGLIEDKVSINVKFIDENDYYEINTYEDLKRIDNKSHNLFDENIQTIMKVFSADISDIHDIKVLKKGMTNRSFLFTINNKKYIMRIPGEGTDKLINRRYEYEVYQIVNKEGICDKVIFMDEKTGVKITEYVENCHVLDAFNKGEVRTCIEYLKKFHDKKLKCNHEFDIWAQLEYYESLFNHESLYEDYDVVKERVLSLKPFIDGLKKERTLTHIDAVADNFLLSSNGINLIDWEYAGMQDPHVDLAMFSIYAGYDKTWVDYILDVYFSGKIDEDTRYKIYSYIATCGLLWSNWCEYKYHKGVEFGEYSLLQYEYAKEFSKLVIKYLDNKNGKNK